jgi:hypothetical protein
MASRLQQWAKTLACHLPWRVRCRWAAEQLLRLQSHQDVLANAAYSIAAGDDRYTMEEVLCSAETIQREVCELAELLAAMSVARELSRHAPKACV